MPPAWTGEVMAENNTLLRCARSTGVVACLQRARIVTGIRARPRGPSPSRKGTSHNRLSGPATSRTKWYDNCSPHWCFLVRRL
jgi:hypothetical protein